ncbi:MAG: hypothetical protein JWO02_746 [Solirubrobacterales bacterium]|nr:hypothetical protein [Solirubrobacterales bacterium]
MTIQVIPANGGDSGAGRVPVVEDPTFTVLDVNAVRHAATPTLRFDMHVSDPAGREIYAIALSVQIQIDPARREYDDATRARLVELFGAPERWGATTHSLEWARIEVLVPGFTGATSFQLQVPCTYDLEVAAAKYFYALPDGMVPLSFHYSGMVLYRGESNGGVQVTPVPWSCSTRWRMPVEAWKNAMATVYPGGGWVRLTPETLQALMDRKAADGHRSLDALVSALLHEECP